LLKDQKLKMSAAFYLRHFTGATRMFSATLHAKCANTCA